MSTSTHTSEVSVISDDRITNSAAQKWSGVVRILLGFTFLWAFFDKNFAWGYSTTKAWMFGTGDGNPTGGFLKFGVNPERSVPQLLHGSRTELAERPHQLPVHGSRCSAPASRWSSAS